MTCPPNSLLCSDHQDIFPWSLLPLSSFVALSLWRKRIFRRPSSSLARGSSSQVAWRFWRLSFLLLLCFLPGCAGQSWLSLQPPPPSKETRRPLLPLSSPLAPQNKPPPEKKLCPCRDCSGWVERIEGFLVVLTRPGHPPRRVHRRQLPAPLEEGDFLWKGRVLPQRRQRLEEQLRQLFRQRRPLPPVYVVP